MFLKIRKANKKRISDPPVIRNPRGILKLIPERVFSSFQRWSMGTRKRWSAGTRKKWPGWLKNRGFLFRTDRQIPIARQLKNSTDSLIQTCKAAEPDFIRLGLDLESVHADASALAKHTVEAVHKIGAVSEQSPLKRISRMAGETLRQLFRYHEQVQQNLRHVDRVIEQLGRLSRLCRDIEKLSIFLRLVALNIQVESARSQEAADMFTVVSEETRKLAGRVIEIAHRMQKDVQDTQAGQIRIYNTILDSARALQKLASDAEKTVTRSVDEIQSMTYRAVQDLKRAGTFSEEISRQVSEIVMGIQIHDSMSQRIGHICSAFEDVHVICRDLSACGPTSDTSANRKKAGTIIALQSAQLKQTHTDVRLAYENSTAAFREISAKAEQLVYILSGQQQDFLKSKDIHSEHSFSALKEALKSLHRIIVKSSEMVRHIQDSAQTAAETSGRLAVHLEDVRNIGFETHLIALNAVVKSAHLGNGGGALEVLAQEMKIVSDRAVMFSEDVETLLASVAESVRKLGISMSDTKTDAQSGYDITMLEKASQTLGENIQEINDGFIRFKEESEDAPQRAARLTESIRRIIIELEFFPELSGQLQKIMDDFTEARSILNPEDHVDYPSVEPDTGKLSGRYSMQQERTVHQAFFLAEREGTDKGAEKINTDETRVNDERPEEADAAKKDASDAAPHQDKENPEEDLEEDLGDNVELF